MTPRRATVLVLSGALAACRFGGPDPVATQPSLDAQWLPDMGYDAGDLTPDLGVPDDSGDPNADTGAPETTVTETDVDAGETLEAATDAGTDASIVDTGVCTPPTPITCDPVKNTGCNAFTRCDVSDSYDTGQCVDLGALGVGAACTTSAPLFGFPGTDTCNHGLTCQSGKCIALCYCDSDCSSGQCCNVSLGANGFSACGGC